MTAPGRQGAPATKTARQARIVAILSREQVHSQEQLSGLLAQYAGLHVTQATLSRDLDELGVVRLRGADGTLVYALPGDPGGPGSRPGSGLDLTNYPERSEASDPPSPLTPAPADPDPSAPGTAASPHPGPGPSSAADSSPSSSDASGSDGAPAATLSAPTPPSSSGGAPSARFTRYLKELLTSAEGSANIVVLRTPAGAAQFLASTIDHAAWPAILGTVAGDDTVLVISRDPTGGEALAAEFRQLAEGRR
jgi:transcriptional regulator of arginine metabolism